MSAVAKASDAKLLELREKAATKARKGIAMAAKGCLMAGQGLVMGAPTFDVTDPTEYRAWCQKVTQKSWETCRQYIAIAKAHAELSSDAKAATEGWAFEPHQRLVATPSELREKVIAEAGTYPDVETVESIRDRVVAENMTADEKKDARKKERERAAAKKERERQGKAEKTEAAVDTLKEKVKGKNVDGLTPEALVLIGVAIGAAFGLEHGTDGTRQFFLQREKAKAELAARDAANVEKGKKAAS